MAKKDVVGDVCRPVGLDEPVETCKLVRRRLDLIVLPTVHQKLDVA